MVRKIKKEDKSETINRPKYYSSSKNDRNQDIN